jgi:hypothetical protein
VLAKVLLEDQIKGREVARVVEPDTAAHDVFGTVPCLCENLKKVANCLMRLRDDVAVDHCTVSRRNLTRDKEPAICLYGTRKRKMLSASSFATLYAISLQAHRDLSLSILY